MIHRIIQSKYGELENTITGHCELTLRGHTDHILRILILSDEINSCRIASCSNDGIIKICKLSRFRNLQNKAHNYCELTLSGHTEGVHCMKMLHDGRIASISYDKTIKIW